jgi:hypothetical protein
MALAPFSPLLRLRLLGLVVLASCRAPSTVRYLVSASPLSIGAVPQRLCIAVDPSDPQGVWWWEPSGPDCARRSTGPGVFHAEQASVSQGDHSEVHAAFRLALIQAPHAAAPPFADVELTLQGAIMRAAATGVQLSIQRRADLAIPGPE